MVHADESCLGNQNSGPSPGGAGCLVEVVVAGDVVRKDWYLCSTDTTNNRMALTGAIEVLKLLAWKEKLLRVTYVSDSKYLVQGITEWVHGWKRRGWKRKGGAIENLEMWRDLYEWNQKQSVNWLWVRGHAGNAKNEYADSLAVRAATEQMKSDGPVDSGFDRWLESEQKKGKFSGYDPIEDFRENERPSR